MRLWEYAMSGILLNQGWKKPLPIIENDALIISFTKKKGNTYGNVGIVFDDEPGQITFTFYLTKSFDENNYRYFCGQHIFEKKDASFFAGRVRELTQTSIEIYHKLSNDDITNSGEKILLE